MKLTIASALVVVASLPHALAHYNFEKFVINGVSTGEYEYVRRTSNSNSPITDQLSNDIRCNQGSFAAAKNTKIYDVVAGVDVVGFTIRDYIGHPGPLFAYLSKSTTADVRDYDGSSDWFKIYELGVDKFATSTTGMTWKSDGIKQYSFVLPRAIPNGQYLLRGEHIGVHGSGTLGGAQHYIGCAQINVTGGTGGSPGPTGKLPGIYSPTDPGILFNPYYPPVTNYTMPGLPVYPPSGGSSTTVAQTTTTRTSTTSSRTTTTPTTTTTTTTTARTTSPTTTTRTTTSATTTTTSTGSGASQPKYGQCGGIGYTGPTNCAAGTTCTVANAYYSQCL